MPIKANIARISDKLFLLLSFLFSVTSLVSGIVVVVTLEAEEVVVTEVVEFVVLSVVVTVDSFVVVVIDVVVIVVDSIVEVADNVEV